MNKRLAGTGLAIGLVAGAGAGLILEMSGSVGAASGNSVVAVAAAPAVNDSIPGATADPAQPDPSTRLQAVLKPLVDAGTITQDQADKVIAALVAAIPARGPDGGPFGGGRHGPGNGRGPVLGLDIVATTLGITTAEVRTALQGGQSIAALAVSKGKTAQNVIDAVVADATTRINAKVTSGALTQPQADQLVANLTTQVTAFVNSTPPFGGRGFGGRGGPGRGGNDNDADDTAPVVTAPVDTTAPTNTVGG